MKQSKFLKLLSLGLVLGMCACGDDDDDPVKDDSDNGKKEQVDNTAYRYYGAELYTKQSFMYGRFEAKMKMAYAPGCISSMFLYYNDSYMGNGKRWNEIDIEVIGKESSGFQTNIITGTAESQSTSEKMYKLSSNVNEDYHIYVVEWTPEYVSWSLDGTEVRRDQSNVQVSSLVEKQSLRFNLWASNNSAWVGLLSSKNIPITQYIDYVKVSSYDEETKEFTELWTDEFDSFDSSRWSRGNWEMERVTETPSNVVVEDGVLQLRLTKEPVKTQN